MRNFLEIEFTDTEELLRMAKKEEQLLRENVASAVANTVLLGVARIANDCPVDTGRARASIAGDLAAAAGVDLTRGKISEGKSQSTTKLDLRNLQGQIGSNVEYIIYLEYGYDTKQRNVKLTRKQLAYLFATGKLKTDAKGNVIPGSIHARINRRADVGGGKVKGKGMFRKNIPILQKHFDDQMNKAIDATREGKRLSQGLQHGTG